MTDTSKFNQVRYLIDDFKLRAQNARRDAHTLTTRAEIWEEAATRLEDAQQRDERNAVGKTGEQK